MTRTEKYKDLRETLKKIDKNKDKYNLKDLYLEETYIQGMLAGYDVYVRKGILFDKKICTLYKTGIDVIYALLEWLESEK